MKSYRVFKNIVRSTWKNSVEKDVHKMAASGYIRNISTYRVHLPMLTWHKDITSQFNTDLSFPHLLFQALKKNVLL